MSVWAWVAANADTLLQVWASIYAAAALIVNLTPTPKDNAVLAAVYRVVEFAAGIVTTKAKQ